MERGFVAHIVREYAVWKATRSEPTPDVRIGAYLLPRNVARALGAQVLILGTQRTEATQRNGRKPGARNLERDWPHELDGKVVPDTWKPQELVVVSNPPDVVYRAHLHGKWADELLPRIRAMFAQTGVATQYLPEALPDDRKGQHPLVRQLCPGSVVSVAGRRAFVLSNEVVHQRHPFGFFVACPLVARTEAVPSDAVSLFLDRERVAWELSQSVTPFHDTDFRLISAPTSASLDALNKARGRFIRLLSGEMPEGARWERCERYFRASAAEFDGLRLSRQVAPLAEPEASPWDPPVVRSSERIDPADHCGSDGSAGLGGECLTSLDVDSDDFALSLRRRGEVVDLHVDVRGDVPGPLRFAWVESNSGAAVASGFAEDVDETGVLVLPLGRVALSAPLEFTIFLVTEVGTEAVAVRHDWLMSGGDW